MKPGLAAGALLGFASLFPGTALGHYASPPPPPPTPSGCIPCSPPPPPSLVPTVSPNTLPRVTAVVSVSVHLSPSRVHRGRRIKLSVVSAPKAPVSLVVRYRLAKPWIMKAHTNGAGKLTRSWKVSWKAPLGRATLIVMVKHVPKPYVAGVSFTIIR